MNGVELDPLVVANDSDKPLASKLLAVPALRQRYLGMVRDLASTWLDWAKLGPVAERYHALIADEVKLDTRKLDSNEAFEASLVGPGSGAEAPAAGGFGPRSPIALKAFADQRRAYLLNLPAVKEAGRQN